MSTQIEFYGKYNLATTRQNISDFQMYFEKRESLYLLLGILPSFFLDRTVLEVGPGSGYNSLYTATLKPSKYVLVEPNKAAVGDIWSLFSKYPDLGKRIRIEQALLEEFSTTETFDFVLCEGMLNGVSDAKGTLAKLTSFVKPGGVLVITCVDSISYFPEILRRLFAQILIKRDEDLKKSVDILLPVLRPHLDALRGMTRYYEDWIVDNMINPAPVAYTVSIAEAITWIGDIFTVYGQSPRFITDWRWYKTLERGSRNFNERAVEQYWLNAHNLLECSRVFPQRDSSANRRLNGLCSEFRMKVKGYEEERADTTLVELDGVMEEIIGDINTFSTELSRSVREAYTIFRRRPVDPERFSRSSFRNVWGRGQQYLSLVKNLG
jgi:SAM-dependent methyltransferase